MKEQFLDHIFSFNRKHRHERVLAIYVFSDWLEERGDPEYVGWRWIADNKWSPKSMPAYGVNHGWNATRPPKPNHGDLPVAVFWRLHELFTSCGRRSPVRVFFKSRYEAFKWLAVALALCTEEERQWT